MEKENSHQKHRQMFTEDIAHLTSELPEWHNEYLEIKDKLSKSQAGLDEHSEVEKLREDYENFLRETSKKLDDLFKNLIEVEQNYISKGYLSEDSE